MDAREHPTVQEQGGTSPDHQHEGEEENEAKERAGPGDAEGLVLSLIHI